MLTTRLKGAFYAGVTVDTRFDPQTDDTYVENAFFGSEVVRWNRDENVIEPLYDLFELASPTIDGETFRASDWNLQTATCSGSSTLSGVEYHHVSSVSVGSTANLLVASRELSTIWSLAHDGSGVQWTLSSQLESDFVFEKAGDEFF